jgi:hypothetical protein
LTGIGMGMLHRRMIAYEVISELVKTRMEEEARRSVKE